MIKNYTYGKATNRNSRIFLFVYPVLFAAGGLFFLILFIMSLFNAGNINSSYASNLFWGFVGLSIWSPILFIFIAYINSDIEVEDDGLKVEFLLQSLFVSWESIEEFKQCRSLGLFNLKRAKVLVTKNSLTPFHSLYGLMYGATNKPAFLIGINISNHEKLFRIIENKLRKNI